MRRKKFSASLHGNLERIVPFLYKSATAIFISIMLFLSYYAFLYTHIFPTDYLERPYPVKDHIFLQLFGLAVFCILLKMIMHIKIKLTQNHCFVFPLLCVCFTLVTGSLFIFDGSIYMTTGDPGYIYQSVTDFLHGNCAALLDGGYLSQYPYQLDLTAYVEICVFLFGTNAIKAMILINLFALAISELVGYFICKDIFGEECASIFIFLFCIFSPIYFYIFFIYGECLSILFSLLFLWAAVSLFRSDKIFFLPLMGIFAYLALAFRINSVIVLITIGIIFLMEGIRQKRSVLLIAIFCCILFVFGGKSMVKGYYENHFGIEIPKGMPASCWISMGMQEGSRGNGWYTEYGVNLFTENQFDSKQTAAIAEKDIKERIAFFSENTKYAWDFYREKILSQWNEPSGEAFLVLYGCIEHDRLSDLKETVLLGKAYAPLLCYMNYFQTFVYSMCLFFGIYLFVKEKKPLYHIFSIILIGGFLFQIIWEAKSRYIFFYMIFLLPAAAYGFTRLTGIIRKTTLRFFDET